MKIAIYGYGNLGRGVELAARAADDTELVGIFTRRAAETVKTATGASVYHISELEGFKGVIDVLILCGGRVLARMRCRTLRYEEPCQQII